jgi:peptidoglycan/xylan/chitin deacetylase (PgdA/CDA1 family)
MELIFMKKALLIEKDVGLMIQYFVLILLVGAFCYFILSYYGSQKNITSQIYQSPYPVIRYDDQYINQTSKIPFPSARPNEKGLKIPILMYHYISYSPWKDDKIRIGLSTPPYYLEQQLQLLQDNGYATISLDDMVNVMAGKMKLPDKPVILTFDDGYADFYQNAYPLLTKYHAKGIVFVITQLIGKEGYLTWPQIEEMAKTDNIMIGSHTLNHLALTYVNKDILIKELTQSKAILEEHLGKSVRWFAYPYGDYNKKVADAVRTVGYMGAVNTVPGNIQHESLLFYLTRYRAGTKLGQDFLSLVE